MKGRSVLIAGASGFIGRVLAARLVADGADVRCLLRRPADVAGEPILLPEFTAPAVSAALGTFEPDVVYNLASYGVRPEDRDADELLRGNIGVVAAILHGARFGTLVQVGSCSEYGAVEPSERIREGAPLMPTSEYGRRKAQASTYATAVAQTVGVRCVVARLFGVYGTGEAPHRLIPYLLDRVRRGESVDLTPGEQLRDLLHVDDAVEGLIRASLVAEGVYNVCSGVPVSVRSVAERVAIAANQPLELLRFGARAYRPDEPMWVVGDPARFEAAAGFRPRIGLHEGIERMVRGA